MDGSGALNRVTFSGFWFQYSFLIKLPFIIFAGKLTFNQVLELNFLKAALLRHEKKQIIADICAPSAVRNHGPYRRFYSVQCTVNEVFVSAVLLYKSFSLER